MVRNNTELSYLLGQSLPTHLISKISPNISLMLLQSVEIFTKVANNVGVKYARLSHVRQQ